MRRRPEVKMTEGNIFPLIINFAIPLLLGSLFQQLYNMVDTWVVGNFVGKNAFSAVGTLSPIINTLIGFFVGFSNGAGVVISRYFGAGDTDKVRSTVHTYVSITAILCVVFTILGIAMTPMMLRFVKSPAEVAVEQATYLRIYFAGCSGLLIYNMGSAILRAVGNSTMPFIFLVVSAVTNIILDLVFVIFFKLGVAGVAYATIIAQLLSAILVLVVLFRTKASVRLSLKHLEINRPILSQIFNVGLPAALQMTITAFSNIFVQSYINQFGADCMGGWTAYAKVDQIIFLPMQALALAVQTFVSQNLGSSNTDRARKGVNTSLLSAIVSTAILMMPVLVFAPAIVTFFIDGSESEVIRYGTQFLRTMTPFYVLCCFNQVLGGALRGSGNSKIPMVIMLCSFVFFRQIYLFIMSNYISNTIFWISMGYPAGWILCSSSMYIAYRIVFKESRLRQKIQLS